MLKRYIYICLYILYVCIYNCASYVCIYNEIQNQIRSRSAGFSPCVFISHRILLINLTLSFYKRNNIKAFIGKLLNSLQNGVLKSQALWERRISTIGDLRNGITQSASFPFCHHPSAPFLKYADVSWALSGWCVYPYKGVLVQIPAAVWSHMK